MQDIYNTTAAAAVDAKQIFEVKYLHLRSKIIIKKMENDNIPRTIIFMHLKIEKLNWK